MPAMKRIFLAALLTGCCAMVWCGLAEAAEPVKPAVSNKQALAAAKALTVITGVAISPLLGVGAVGAYDWMQARTPEEKAKLPWYAQIHFWLPALLLVAAVAAKDALGTALPPGLKKPLDVAETVENKVTGLVAAGAVVPSIAAIFHSSVSAAVPVQVMQAGILGVSFAPVLNILTIPLAVTAFALVWLVGHVINVLILISPFGIVDAALKSARTALIGLLTAVHFINPWWGAVLSLVIVVIAYFVAGWSFRLMMFGSVFTWDFCTRRRKRFVPAPNSNWMFTARKLERTPVRTYGKLVKAEAGSLTFEYRPWLLGSRQTIPLPAGKYAVGRGLFYPEILLVEGEKTKSLLTMPPRYKKHEEEIAKAYGIADLRDTGILRGLKAIWSWGTRILFGEDRKEVAATVPG
jgi:hypothetical protein